MIRSRKPQGRRGHRARRRIQRSGRRGGSSEALCNEAIRLARLLRDLLSDGEVIGLLALVLLEDSRRAARLDADGDMCLLDDQDRALWDRERIVDAEAQR